jgi:hypothetical protein
VQPHGLPLQVHHLAFQADGARAPIAPDELVPHGAAVKLRLAGGAVREREAVAWVKERIQERFRR